MFQIKQIQSIQANFFYVCSSATEIRSNEEQQTLSQFRIAHQITNQKSDLSLVNPQLC
jgi:hypothetical protein